MSERRTTSGPKPWPQYEARTTFLRAPTVDWPSLIRGLKSEFRMSGRQVTQLWNIATPCPVVMYHVPRTRDPESKLMVLERTWREPLGSASEESLERMGMESFAHFRRYWMERQKQRFRPLMEVHVYRVRTFETSDREALGLALLDKLYGDHMP